MDEGKTGEERNLVIFKGVSIDPTAPFKMYYVGFRAFKSPYMSACRDNSRTPIFKDTYMNNHINKEISARPFH